MQKLLSAIAFLIATMFVTLSADAQNTLCRQKCLKQDQGVDCSSGHDDGDMGDCVRKQIVDADGNVTGDKCEGNECVEPSGGGGEKEYREGQKTDSPGNTGGTMYIVICFMLNGAECPTLICDICL